MVVATGLLEEVTLSLTLNGKRMRRAEPGKGILSSEERGLKQRKDLASVQTPCLPHALMSKIQPGVFIFLKISSLKRISFVLSALETS